MGEVRERLAGLSDVDRDLVPPVVVDQLVGTDVIVRAALARTCPAQDHAADFLAFIALEGPDE